MLDFTDALEALLKRTETRPWQTTPPFILELLLDNFNINTDYYASPLDHNNRIPRFCSYDKRDWVFGATILKLDTRWTRDGYAKPDYNDIDMMIACDKAIEAASTTKTTIFMLLPMDRQGILQTPR